MKDLNDIIKQAIDIHFHIGPEVIPRKYTVDELITTQQGKIGGLVLKNHFYPTAPFIKEIKNMKNVQLFGSVVLNNAVGGLNPEAIYASSLLLEKPIVVWMPTINAENFLQKSTYEIAPEWVQRKEFVARKSQQVKPVIVTKNNKVTKETIAVLKMVKQCNAVLATGHIAWRECIVLIEKALKMGIKKIVLTHPIYQRINMPITIQKQLARKGCFIEQSYSMYSIDKIPIAKIAKQIQKVGAKSVVLSSDVGQLFSPPPSEALKIFSELLIKEGVTKDELYKMLVVNPKKLLG